MTPHAALWSWCVLLLLVTVACGSRPDTQESVRTALDEAGMHEVQVEVDREANLVHLRGTVASTQQRNRAEEIATAAVGTTGRVLNELAVAGLNDQTADDLDDEIADTLERTIERDAVLSQRDIDFEVRNGVVTIKGEVASAEEKSRVTQLVQAAPGVRDSANALEIRTGR